MRLRTLLLASLAVMNLSAPAHAQILGSFSWQMQPYCNIVTFTVIQQGERFQLAGTDNLCGAGSAPVVGTAVLAGADVALGFTVNLASGRAAHVSAVINLNTLSGSWSDDGGNTGALLLGANTGGSPRPAPSSGMNASAPLALTSSATEIPLSVVATASGTIANPEPGIYSLINNTNGVRPAVRAEVNSQFSNFGTAGIYAISSGTGGFAGLFHASNPAGNGPALVAIANGNGNAITASAANSGHGVETTAGDNGNSLYAWKPTYATGRAIRAVNYNQDNTSDVVSVQNQSTQGGRVALRAVDGPREARLATAAYAAYFVGNVLVTGSVTKGSGTFKIDHPLDPANRYLSHSFVESPEMKNVYDGVVTLDAGGEASVTLPNWFETLNSDFRYQLTAIGGPAPALHVSRKIANGQFAIAGGTPGIEVSWQVTGIRKDPSALHNPIVVETDKPIEERGYYLDPAAYGLPEEKGVAWATSPRTTETEPTPPASGRPRIK